MPTDLAEGGRLRLAQQMRGGVEVDTLRLRGGETLRGTLREGTFRVRTPYGALELARAAVASILFDDRGLGRVVLANGDTVSGYLETTELHLSAGTRTDSVPTERLAELSLRRATPPTASTNFRAAMRNGDSLSVGGGFGLAQELEALRKSRTEKRRRTCRGCRIARQSHLYDHIALRKCRQTLQ